MDNVCCISYITFTYSSIDVSRAALIKIGSDKTLRDVL